MDSKADPNIKSGNNGRIPLHCAVQNGHDKDCRLLVEYNSLIDPPDNDGNTPILAVSKNGSIPILKLLLEHGGNLYVRYFYSLLFFKTPSPIGQFSLDNFKP